MTSGEITCVAKPEAGEEIDVPGYLAANPDAGETKASAFEHFDNVGRKEGRLQFVNISEVQAQRERKLKKLRFLRPPSRERSYGEPINFLTDQEVVEFRIPDAPPVSANQYAQHFLNEIKANPGKLYLDVGAGLRYVVYENLINTEIYPSISTDVICIGETLPFVDDQFDFVICASVLEHTRRPWDVAREICRVTKPGGKILIDYPFLQGVHGFPHHYFNATPQGAISLFEEFCDIESSLILPNNHPIHSLWWFLSNWKWGLYVEQDRKDFESLTIAEVLAKAPEEHLAERFCLELIEPVLRTIPAGSTLLANKRSVPSGIGLPKKPLESEQAAHADRLALQQVYASTSWRVTAPIRMLSRLGRRILGPGF